MLKKKKEKDVLIRLSRRRVLLMMEDAAAVGRGGQTSKKNPKKNPPRRVTRFANQIGVAAAMVVMRRQAISVERRRMRPTRETLSGAPPPRWRKEPNMPRGKLTCLGQPLPAASGFALRAESGPTRSFLCSSTSGPSLAKMDTPPKRSKICGIRL